MSFWACVGQTFSRYLIVFLSFSCGFVEYFRFFFENVSTSFCENLAVGVKVLFIDAGHNLSSTIL